MKPAKLVIVAAAITVYVACPVYRYYVLGSWVVYKIMNDKPRKYHVIPRGSKMYEKVIREAVNLNGR